MKKLFLLITILNFIFPLFTKASHYMGGEITWECMVGPNYTSNQQGRYRFHLKLYRECYSTSPGSSSATFGTTETMITTVPGLSSISMSIKPGWPKDISTTCNNPALSIKCVGGTAPNNVANSGAIQEYYYTSDGSYPNGVLILGIPPTTGWMFYNESCCRNPSTNITNASSLGYRLRAIMYPYNGQNANPCFDNSPTFAEYPKTVLCSGYPFSFGNVAKDKEFDSLTYSWGQPLDQGGGVLTAFAAGYSFTSPLPGINHNPNNVPATLNSKNGLITFKSYTNGAFVTSTKVTAYKNGTKTAEIWRDIQVVISNCGSNSPPKIYRDTTELSQNFSDTVYVDDTAHYVFNMMDLGSTIPLKLVANGSQFGSYLPAVGPLGPRYDTAGCANPPCASLTNAGNFQNPYSGYLITSIFDWKVKVNHLDPNSLTKDYLFTFEVDDDYCPIPAKTIVNLNLHIKIPFQVLSKSILDSVRVINPAGDVTLFWKKPNDPDQVFAEYQIYSSEDKNGPYQLVQSISNYNTTSFTYAANAGIKPIYYFIKVKCQKTTFVLYTEHSDTLVTKFYDLKVLDIQYISLYNYPFTVKIKVLNGGNQSITNYKLAYDIPGLTSQTDTISGILHAKDTFEYYFQQTNLITPPIFTLCGSAMYSSDYNSANNLMCIQGITGINEQSQDIFHLEQNIPNPTKGLTQIRFDSPFSGILKLEVRNVLGQIVYFETMNIVQGKYSKTLDLTDFKEGVYFYSVEMLGYKQSKRMIILK